jgi:hypothetical protein
MKNKTFTLVTISLLVLFAAMVFLPQFSQAHTGGHPPGSASGWPLVPGPGPLQLCELWHMGVHIINFLLFILALPILVIMFLWGGILFLTSTGNPSQIEKAKKLFVAVLIGVIIAFAAWIIINTIMVTLANGSFSAGWNTITCPTVTQVPPNTSCPAGPGQPCCSSTPQCQTGLNCYSGTCSATCGQLNTPCCPTGPQQTNPCGTGLTCQAGMCLSQSLVCSANSISSAVQSLVSCVIGQAPQFKFIWGVNINNPALNQLNGGGHTCNLAINPPSISCHYGGTLCNGIGNAADFSLSPAPSQPTAQTWAALQAIVAGCGAAGGAFCETSTGSRSGGCSATGVNHVHANASASCGCN